MLFFPAINYQNLRLSFAPDKQNSLFFYSRSTKFEDFFFFQWLMELFRVCFCSVIDRRKLIFFFMSYWQNSRFFFFFKWFVNFAVFFLYRLTKFAIFLTTNFRMKTKVAIYFLCTIDEICYFFSRNSFCGQWMKFTIFFQKRLSNFTIFFIFSINCQSMQFFTTINWLNLWFSAANQRNLRCFRTW